MDDMHSVAKEDRDTLLLGIMNDDRQAIVGCIKKCPAVMQTYPSELTTWLSESVAYGRIEIARILIESGCPVNVTSQSADRTTPLEKAVRQGKVDMVSLFLKHGADPNFGDPLVSALSTRKAEYALAIFRLLLEHGADPNRITHPHDPVYAFATLDRAPTEEIRQLLIKYGAKTLAELRAEQSNSPRKTPLPTTGDFSQEVVAHFEKMIGPASSRSLIQIVPTGIPIGIHAIPPKGNRKHLTLFTNGLSLKAMNTPAGEEGFRYAELFIELPGDWKIKEVKDMNWAWPLYWLRKMAQYPHKANSWLGGPVTLITNDDPPQPLWPASKFTTLLLFAETSFQRSDGNTVQLYRVIPLYTSEWQFEVKHGLKRLMQSLDQHEVPFVVDINRAPFA